MLSAERPVLLNKRWNTKRGRFLSLHKTLTALEYKQIRANLLLVCQQNFLVILWLCLSLLTLCSEGLTGPLNNADGEISWGHIQTGNASLIVSESFHRPSSACVITVLQAGHKPLKKIYIAAPENLLTFRWMRSGGLHALMSLQVKAFAFTSPESRITWAVAAVIFSLWHSRCVFERPVDRGWALLQQWVK